MFPPALLTSKSVELSTPQDFYDKLNDEFHFDVDVCATSENAKTPFFLDARVDGLSKSWSPWVCWMNPPYGKTIRKWCAKAMEESGKGATVVGLLPSRTDTRWWWESVMPVFRGEVPGEVRFVKGRLKFGGKKTPAPFPSVVVVWRARGTWRGK